MTAADVLAKTWCIHPIVVERKTGDGPRGPLYAAPTTEHAKISSNNRLVLNDKGAQVVSANRCSMHVDTPQIPIGSKVTLPASFGSKTAKVITDSRHDGGALTPNFYSVDLG